MQVPIPTGIDIDFDLDEATQIPPTNVSRAAVRHPVRGYLPPRTRGFIGRRQRLAQLQRRLNNSRLTVVLPQTPYAGGVGKTQLAVEYAHRHQCDFDVIWWIPADHPAQIQSALVDLGRCLGLDTELEASVAVPTVGKALQIGIPHTNWLLIFDNAEDPDMVQRFIPDGDNGKVLVTSHNPRWADVNGVNALYIDVFSRRESIELLRYRNRDMTVDDADRLARTLGDLPLAIAHACMWLATTQTTAGEYLRLLEGKRAELTDAAAVPRYPTPEAVSVTWDVALDRLGQENPGALALLQACSAFAAERIGRELLTGLRNAQIPPALDTTLHDLSLAT